MKLVSVLVWMLLSQAVAAQAARLPLEVHHASDGSLLLRNVEALVLADAIEVSGRVHRSLLTRVIAGRTICVMLLSAAGTENASQCIPVPVARLPHRSGARSRFTVRLAAVAKPGDTVRVTIPAVGETP